MNYEAVLLALYESYTQIGALISEGFKSGTREVQAGMGTPESPSRVEVHSEDPKRREFDYKEKRMELELRRKKKGPGQPASPKKPGMFSKFFKKNK